MARAGEITMGRVAEIHQLAQDCAEEIQQKAATAFACGTPRQIKEALSPIIFKHMVEALAVADADRLKKVAREIDEPCGHQKCRKCNMCLSDIGYYHLICIGKASKELSEEDCPEVKPEVLITEQLPEGRVYKMADGVDEPDPEDDPKLAHAAYFAETCDWHAVTCQCLECVGPHRPDCACGQCTASRAEGLKDKSVPTHFVRSDDRERTGCGEIARDRLHQGDNLTELPCNTSCIKCREYLLGPHKL